MITPVILASGSASRRALLEGAGVDSTAIKPDLDEESYKVSMRADGLAIADQAMRLAELKAEKVSREQSGLVIGGDQMLALGERAFDKPKDLEDARRHLNDLSGKAHTLETAIAVAEGGTTIWRHHAQPRLTMRGLSPSFIEKYLHEVGPEICNTVGGYQLEGLGSQLFSRIEGDYFSILGLPLLPLLDYLRTRGVLET
ncbi:MAG: Maf family protein [Pseudomonadota bacterium]